MRSLLPLAHLVPVDQNAHVPRRIHRGVHPELAGAVDIPSGTEEVQVDTVAEIGDVVFFELDPAVRRAAIVDAFGGFEDETLFAAGASVREGFSEDGEGGCAAEVERDRCTVSEERKAVDRADDGFKQGSALAMGGFEQAGAVQMKDVKVGNAEMAVRVCFSGRTESGLSDAACDIPQREGANSPETRRILCDNPSIIKPPELLYSRPALAVPFALIVRDDLRLQNDATLHFRSLGLRSLRQSGMAR